MDTIRVNIRELKSRLSHYLRLTKAGQIVEITERGKPVGRVIPWTSPPEDRLNALATLGLLLRGKEGLPPREAIDRKRTTIGVADLLIEDRDWM